MSPDNFSPEKAQQGIKRWLSREEIKAVTARSDWRGGWAVLRTWLVIIATFAVVIFWTNPLTLLLAVVVLGGQQLALAILSHEATHFTLFKTRSLNDTVSDWLCARPVWLDVARYREHHKRHHSFTGLENDPDLGLITPFPTSKDSLRRKFLRDLSGSTGLRRVLGLLLMDAGVLKYTVSSGIEKLPQQGRRWWHYLGDFSRNFAPVLIMNLLIAAALMAVGAGWAWFVWLAAYLTTFSLFLRIRAIAEHACLEDSDDMLKNTRTTNAGWLARMTVAPFYVNYHVEHHLMASVPFYRLPQLHKLLLERGAVTPVSGYREVLSLAGGVAVNNGR